MYMLNLFRKQHAKNHVTMAIAGMHCAGCASAIAAELETIPGVRRVRASYAKQSVDLEYTGAPAVLAQCEVAITALGYQVAAK